MKDAYYFPHDSNARMDIRIIELRVKHGWAGYGLYWAIIEVLREQDDYRIQANKKHLLSTCLGCASDVLEPVLETCLECGADSEPGLLVEEDGFISSPSLTRRMNHMDAIREKRRIAGSMGGKKQTSSKTEANAKQMLSIKGSKGSKEKEVKEIKETTTTSQNSVAESDDSTTSSRSVPAQEIFDAWNKVWEKTPIPAMRELTKTRRVWIKREFNKKRDDLSTADDFRNFFLFLRDGCPFIRDSVASGKTWFSFDWLFKWENNFVKAYEGNYQNRGKTK